MATQKKTEIEKLERAFWDSMVQNDPKTATGMLANEALMVSGHGVNKFDHAAYTKMSKDSQYKMLDYSMSDVDVLFPTDDVAIASYKCTTKMEMDGKPMTMDAVNSSTWVKMDDGWKCASHTESVQAPEAHKVN